MKNYIFFILVVLLVINGCRKDELLTDSRVNLSFSSDTVRFDTIFTGFGSVTRSVKVFNNNDGDLNIDNIALLQGANSFFRLNIDGRASSSLNDYTLRKKDSLFIFIEATIDPSDENSPLIINDSIRFSLNGKEQFILLEAYGQNVNLYFGETIEEDEVWTSDKPYLIYRNLIIDTSAVLTIERGSRVYLHNQSSIVVSGSLEVNGTIEEPVYFGTDRLEEYFQDKSGQWGTIVFLPGSENNIVDYALVNHAIAGFQVGSPYDAKPASLRISNTKIKAVSGVGIYAFGAKIIAHNLVISDFSSAALAIYSGGEYVFSHCTFGNPFYTRAEATLAIQNPFVFENYFNPFTQEVYDIPFGGDLVRADFYNCIMQGSRIDQGLVLENEGEGLFNYYFSHNIIYSETEELDTSDFNVFNNIYWTDTVNFVNQDSLNFRLSEQSFARNIGSSEIYTEFPEMRFDILGADRTLDEAPDIGAYEYQPE
jgi:hypothetical protein